MGEIKKQGFQNSIIFYVGVFLGYVNVVLLFPKFFTNSEFGLTRLLISFSQVLGILAHLGFNNIVIKYFPYFRDNKNYHHGFLFLTLLIPFIGFILVGGLFVLFKPLIFDLYASKAKLFTQNFYWVLPFTFFQLYFEVLLAYCRALYKSVLPIFLREIGIRLIVMISILLTTFQIIDFQVFLYLFLFAYSSPVILIVFYLVRIDEFRLTPQLNYLSKPFIKEMASYGAFTLGNQFSNILNQRIDILMLSAMIGLKEQAVYTIAFFIGKVVLIPSRGLAQIVAPATANAFAKNDKEQIQSVYQKTSLNQLLSATFVFLLIWFNVAHILEIINPNYLKATYVVFFVGLSKIFVASTGNNNQIILQSRYYKYNLLFIVILLVLTVLFNLWLIPVYGIVGAAIGTAISALLNNCVKSLFIWNKMGYQPFSYGFLKLLLIIAITSVVGYFLPEFMIFEESDLWNNMTNIIYKCVVITLTFGLGILLFKPSEDIEETLRKLRKRFLVK